MYQPTTTGGAHIRTRNERPAGHAAMHGPPPQPIGPPWRLTVREFQVLGLIGEGQSTAAIARRLGYSESTIKGTIKEVMRRLGAKNRTHAVAIAIRAKAL